MNKRAQDTVNGIPSAVAKNSAVSVTHTDY